MKKSFSFLILLLIAFGAQGREKVNLQFGSRAGVNSSFSRNSPSGYSVSSQIGFNAGVYCHISNIWKKLYIQPGVDYYFNSYKYERNFDNRDDKINTHNIQIPITVGYTLVEKGKLFWKVDTGPMFSILAGVSDNDFGITRDYYKPVVGYWRTQTYLRIGKLAFNAGFDAAMTEMYEGSGIRAHSWYAGLGFNL